MMDGLVELVKNECDDKHTWCNVLKPFVEKYEKHGSMKDKWKDEDKILVLKSLIPFLNSALKDNDDDFVLIMLATFRVISRDRTGVDVLYEEQVLPLFLSLVGDFENKLDLSASASVLVCNLMVLNRPKVYAAVKREGCVGKFVRTLEYALTTSRIKYRFTSARILFLITLDDELASACIQDHDVYTVMVKGIHHVVVDEGSFADEAAHQERRALSELMKVVFNLTMIPTRPTLEASVSAEEYERFGNAVAVVLGTGSVLPDFEAEEAAYKAMLDERPELSADELRQDVNLDDAADANGDNAVPRSDPNRPDMAYVKSDTTNVLMYQPDHLARFLEEQPRALYGMCELLDRHARMPKRELLTYITPLMVVFSGLAKASVNARKMFKRYIFKHLAVPPVGPVPPPSPDDENANQKKMRPQGAEKERATDNVVKYTLLGCVTSMDFTVKNSVEEFLWQLAEEQSNEYIRLCGFGNAVGLLVNRGLPGFAHMKSQAIDIDQLMASGKKL